MCFSPSEFSSSKQVSFWYFVLPLKTFFSASQDINYSKIKSILSWNKKRYFRSSLKNCFWCSRLATRLTRPTAKIFWIFFVNFHWTICAHINKYPNISSVVFFKTQGLQCRHIEFPVNSQPWVLERKFICRLSVCRRE